MDKKMNTITSNYIEVQLISRSDGADINKNMGPFYCLNTVFLPRKIRRRLICREIELPEKFY